MNRRALKLNRESLSPLHTDELAGLAGAAAASLPGTGCVVLTEGTACRTFEYSCLNCVTHPPCTAP